MVQALPRRNVERIQRMCAGAIALAKSADSRPFPTGLVDSLNQLPSRGPKITGRALLTQVLERARPSPRVVSYGSKEFLNYLVGGFRPGFSPDGLDAAAMRVHLEREHSCRFPNEDREAPAGFPIRCRQIERAAKEERAPGLYVSFNHWTDLALEMWGDLVVSSAGFSIGLMIVGKDAYPFRKTQNVGLHCYDDYIGTWSHLWEVFLRGSNHDEYRDIAGGTHGVIDLAKALGMFMRQCCVWPTNAIAYFRNWEDSASQLPKASLKDQWSIRLLAFQIWLLRPRYILVLGSQTPEIVAHAIELASTEMGENPSVVCVRHSAFKYQIEQDAQKLVTLRQSLLA